MIAVNWPLELNKMQQKVFLHKADLDGFWTRFLEFVLVNFIVDIILHDGL